MRSLILQVKAEGTRQKAEVRNALTFAILFLKRKMASKEAFLTFALCLLPSAFMRSVQATSSWPARTATCAARSDLWHRRRGLRGDREDRQLLVERFAMAGGAERFPIGRDQRLEVVLAVSADVLKNGHTNSVVVMTINLELTT
jgi:hypothetical protein